MIVLERNVVDGERTVWPDIDAAAVGSIAALDGALLIGAAVLNGEMAADIITVGVNPEDVAVIGTAAEIAAELMTVQVDGHRSSLDVEVAAELNIFRQLNVRTIGLYRCAQMGLIVQTFTFKRSLCMSRFFTFIETPHIHNQVDVSALTLMT